MKEIPALIARIAGPNDLIIIQGAGNINRIVPEIIAALEEKS